jgi:CheY-like chemotaxis protein
MESAAQMPTRPRPAGSSRNSEKTRVLVVEDENDIAGLIKHTLERGGHTSVEVAASGDSRRAVTISDFRSQIADQLKISDLRSEINLQSEI